MDAPAVGRIGIAKHAGQAADVALQGHGFLGAPDDELRLLAEAPFLRAAGGFVPHSDAAPDPARTLQGVGHGRQLPPVDEQADGRAGPAQAVGFVQPVGHEVRPAALVHLVTGKIGQCLVRGHRTVFLVGGLVFSAGVLPPEA